jgi:hypothetical protein
MLTLVSYSINQPPFSHPAKKQSAGHNPLHTEVIRFLPHLSGDKPTITKVFKKESI